MRNTKLLNEFYKLYYNNGNYYRLIKSSKSLDPWVIIHFPGEFLVMHETVYQEPFLFTGTLRYNLDPFEEFGSEEIWDALTKSHLCNMGLYKFPCFDHPLQQNKNSGVSANDTLMLSRENKTYLQNL